MAHKIYYVNPESISPCIHLPPRGSFLGLSALFENSVWSLRQIEYRIFDLPNPMYGSESMPPSLDSERTLRSGGGCLPGPSSDRGDSRSWRAGRLGLNYLRDQSVEVEGQRARVWEYFTISARPDENGSMGSRWFARPFTRSV